MGFLLFAARKMQLKREINQNSYEQIIVSNQLQAATKRVAQFQEQMSQAKNTISVFSRALQAGALQNGYGEFIDQNRYNTDDDYKAQINEQMRNGAFQTQISNAQNGAATLAATFSNVADSIFTAVSNVQLEQLKAEENRLENKQTSLQTMAKLLETEYQSYDEALQASVKDAAPKFGLA